MLNLIRTRNALMRNNFLCEIFEKGEDAINFFLEEIEAEDSVGFGGSMTLDSLDLYNILKSRDHQVYWHWKDKEAEVYKNAANAQIYVSSANAITELGEVYNIDGNGNRVASLAFGHKKVFIFVGRNKIVRDLKDAQNRTRNIVAPLNAKRLNIETPCTIHNKCMSCNSPNKICNIELALTRAPGAQITYVLLINEELGY